MSLARLAIFLALGTAALPLWADAPKSPAPSSATTPSVADPELVEFLADWQGNDGQWVDPMTFDRIDPAKLGSHDSRRRGKAPVVPPAAGTGSQPTGSDSRRAL